MRDKDEIQQLKLIILDLVKALNLIAISVEIHKETYKDYVTQIRLVTSKLTDDDG